MSPEENKKLLKVVDNLRRQVVLSIAQKKSLKVSRKARAKIDAGVTIDEAVTIVVEEAKPLRRVRRHRLTSPTKKHGLGHGERDTGEARPSFEPGQPTRSRWKRSVIFIICSLVVVAILAAATAYWRSDIWSSLLSRIL